MFEAKYILHGMKFMVGASSIHYEQIKTLLVSCHIILSDQRDRQRVLCCS